MEGTAWVGGGSIHTREFALGRMYWMSQKRVWKYFTLTFNKDNCITPELSVQMHCMCGLLSHTDDIVYQGDLELTIRNELALG